MEQQRETPKMIVVFLLTIANIPTPSYSQNLYALTFDLSPTNGDRLVDHAWLQPLNTTTSVYRETTTYVPFSTTARSKEILDSSETNVLGRHARPSYRHEEYTGDDDDEDDDNGDDSSEELSDPAIAYSGHEEAGDVPTKPKYVAPGLWAKPPPDKDIPLDFVPTKLHAQVRGTHTVKRLPQREAIESAETDEEKHNAHRLKEVVTNSKVNTVYTEEGYEDSAYDHAGHARDADFHEGFARKLHDRENDRRDSSSGDKRRGNSAPDEFKEYDEDYQDHLEENRKQEEAANEGYNLIGYGGDIWRESETDPKFVAEDGIRKLQEDVEENAVEAEKSSKDYRNAQESKIRKNDVDVDPSGSEESREEDDSKDEENKPAAKKKTSKLQNVKIDALGKGTQKLRKLDQRKKKLRRKNHEATVAPLDDETVSPVDADTPASPHGFVTTNPASLREYSVDQTTLRYVAPNTAASFRSIDEPTTVSYSQLFWDHFKAKKDTSSTEATALVPDSTTTTMSPRVEERTPIAVATIDGHGPYLLVTKNETTMLPSTFLGSPTFRSLFSDGVKFGTGFAHHLPGQSDDGNYIDSINNAIAQSTAATFTSVQPLALETLQSSQPEDAGEFASSTLLDGIASSSTPAVMTLNFTKEAYARLTDYHANPFLGPILDNSDIAIARDNFKYKVLVRPRPKSPVKPVVPKSSTERTLSSSTSQEEDENKKIRDELNAKYAKVLDYLKNKQKIWPLPENKKIVFPNLTLMRPPAPQRTAYPIFPTNRPPLAAHSSASVESESPREANWRGTFLRDQRRSQPNAAQPPFHIEPFAIIQPVRLSYRKNLLPATRLLPPLPIAITHANYRSNSQSSDDHPSYNIDEKRQKQQQYNNTSKYFPLFPETSWRTRSRRKRSNDDEPREDASDAKAAANNSVTNDGESREQWVELTSSRATGTIGARDGESVTFAALTNKNNSATADDGESRHIEARHEDAKETANRYSELVGRAPTLSRSEARREVQVNDTSEEELAKKKRDVLQGKARSEENTTSITDGRGHEELLDESPRISGDFIDKEITVRFNEDTNETSTKAKDAKKVEVEVPSFDYVDELAKDDSPVELSVTTEAAVDLKKYPFYNNEDVPSASALKYVVDPGTVPRKTSRGMEFYDSRNAYKRCDEVEPDLDKALPETEEPDPERGPQEDLPRLRGLGEKLDCYKAKYFDENPLDSPLFSEKLIGEPTPPSELNPMKFASKVLLLPKENDEYIVHRLSKKPERNGRRWRNRNPQYETHDSIRVNYGHDPQTGKGRNAYMHSVRGSRPSAEAPKRPVAVRRVKNRRTRLKISSTTPIMPKLYQTASYQNQVYEDVMGNIRNMANAYQVYEMTTELPPATQILATAGSETALKVSNATANSSSKEKTTASLPDVNSNKKSSEIKGLLPPPKYTTPRQATYRKHRPSGKGRMPLLRSPDLPRIIAHHHTIKINKRSATEDIAKNSSAGTNDEDDKGTLGKSMGVDVIGNDTVGGSVEETTQKIANLTVEALDMETEESRQIRARGRHPEVDKEKRRSSTSSDQRHEPSQRVVYTIRDRIRYSKPKWNTAGFGKFNASARSAADEDSRRKEPRYNHFKRKKLIPDRWNNSTIPPRYNSTAGASDIESAASSTEGGESGTTEIYRPAESILQQSVYDKKNAPEESESSAIDSKFDEHVEEETERTATNMYRVHEDVDEDVPATTTKRTSILSSKEILDLQEYLETDPSGYAETFRDEEATTPSSKPRANVMTEERDEEQDEEAEYPEKLTSPWEDNSSENAEEQIEMPAKTESSAQEDSSEEHSSKEEEDSNDDHAFFRYTTRPSWVEDKRKDESEKATFYHPFPFSRYKSMRKEKSDEDDAIGDSEEEKGEDYLFPWHADKEGKDGKRERLQGHDGFEYPWEKRERLARERRRKQRRANRFKETIFDDDDDDDEEESRRYEKPIYPWDRYNVPSKGHVNTRRDVSPSNTDDNAGSSTEQLPLMKFSSKYSSVDSTTVKPSSAREISKSIKKFLEKDFDDESREEGSKGSTDRSSSSAHKSSPSPRSRGISRGTLVPENITQPPRRRSGRRRINPRVDKSLSSSSLFNSKELGSKEIDDKEEDVKPVVEYLGLNKSNLDGSESQVETAKSESRTSSPIAQRKKRRRTISKKNSTISLDNATAASITEPTRRRRRKPQGSITTSATSSAGNDLETSKSVFRPIRSRYSKTDDVEETSKSSSFGRVPVFTGKITDANTAEVETSTPKIRTVEHRSRVSKEKIVTKTTYPTETGDFDYRKRNVTSARKDPAKKLKVKLNRRKNNDRQNANDGDRSDKEKSTKQKDEERNYDTKLNNEDEIKKLMVSEKPNVKSEDNALKSLGMRKEEVKKINNFSALDGLISDEDDSDGDDFGSVITSETYAVNGLLQNIPPSRRNGGNGAKERIANESNKAKEDRKEQISNEKEGEKEEKQKSLLQTKFIKDPERRLYYYIERK